VVVDIRLLGPLEVSAGGVLVPLGGPRQRTLLGLLALRAPNIVSRTYLIDGIWGERPPGSASKTLHAHVAYVRRALAGVGVGDLIVTRQPGYALAVNADDIDARRFEALVRRGRSAWSAGAAAQAAGHLREALQLWRGDVLADCPLEEWARADAAGFQETRLYAVEDLCAAELALGQHARVAAELEATVMRDPLRERLWELLMTALYHSGRSGDALAAYQRARAVLAQELGIEPGPALRRLELAILNGDPVGGEPVAAPTVVVVAPSRIPLPVPLTRLIGRTAEVAEIGALVATRRLVTITGVGGCGKTRVAIAVAGIVVEGPEPAGDVAEHHGSGARFVDLTAVTDPDLLASTVAAALGVPERSDVGPLDLLIQHLRPSGLLLVLDNCEHLVDACAELVDTLLTGCPDLRVLATSREPLGVPGEVAWPLSPLSIPTMAPEAVTGLDELRGHDAVELFLDRAAVPAVRALHDGDAPALAAICARLDGLPLAIELAAARTTVLTLPEIAARIHDPALLRRAAPGQRGHHHALDTTMAWSYQLLDPALRESFRRLAVFAGGFTLDAVEAVVPAARGRAVDVVSDLLARSLAVMGRDRHGARYRLLETIRQYARDRLAELPEEFAAARRQHADHYRRLAEEVSESLYGPELERLLDRMNVEHENFQAALVWFAEHGEGSDELRLAAALARYCHLRGRYREGRRWLGDALARHDGGASPELAKALQGAAFLAFFECDYTSATAYGERALQTQRELANLPGIGRSLSMLASVDRERGNYERSLARYAEAVETYRAAADEPGVADTLQMAGFTSWLTGDLERAERFIDDALARFDLAGDPEGVASARVHLAAVAHYAGEAARARWLAEDALARFRDLDFKEGIAWALNIAGLVECCDGQPGRAVELLRASLGIHCQVGDRWRAASVLEALAAVLVDGAAGTAVELLAAASSIRGAIGAPIPPCERADRDATVARLHSALPDHEYYAAWAHGEALRLGDLPGRLASAVEQALTATR
jgi:predicted ATPase/DNA-binding SARP family transcriptional activator